MRAITRIAKAKRSLRLLAFVTLLWMLLLFGLMGWWAWVVHSQAQQIAQLQTLAGLSSTDTQARRLKTERMLMWEGGAYFMLLAGLTGALGWFYWRERRRTKQLQAFFASVTHELKTPLTSIRLQAESLAETAQATPLIERLLEDTSRLEAQVEKTLELARIEGGGELMLRPLPLRTWLERFRVSAAGHGGVVLELTPRTETTEPLALADTTALRIIFRNLVENTARHSQAKPPHANLSLSSSGDQISIVFSDAGQGFSGAPDRLGLLFFRGERSQGSGVGLYLIQMLMRRMGGSAEFNTRPGAGFETRLHFRRAEDMA